MRKPGVAGLLLALTLSAHSDYSEHPEAEAFTDHMVSEHGFEREQIQAWLSEAEKRQNILDAIARPAERTLTWAEYRPIFVVPLRVNNGVAFWREHKDILARAEKEFGVPAEIIVAIIGVETNYGRNMGSHRVIDALSTLAFDYPPRSDFFRRELENYFLLMREQEQNPLDFKGSYAGAMGYGQFMPSSYRHYAIDFDGDGFTDIWNNRTDAIGSVANYFSRHGWRADEPVAVRVRTDDKPDDIRYNSISRPETPVSEWRERGFQPVVPVDDAAPASPLQLEGDYGEEFWFGFHNFYVITRYNRSHLYAMAVYDLSRELRSQLEAGE